MKLLLIEDEKTYPKLFSIFSKKKSILWTLYMTEKAVWIMA